MDKKFILFHGGKGGKGKGSRDNDAKVNWTYLGDDIFEQQHDNELKSVLHSDYVEAVDTTSTSTEAPQQQPLEDEPQLTSVFHELEFLAGNW
jgi:hypothetical protein